MEKRRFSYDCGQSVGTKSDRDDQAHPHAIRLKGASECAHLLRRYNGSTVSDAGSVGNTTRESPHRCGSGQCWLLIDTSPVLLRPDGTIVPRLADDLKPIEILINDAGFGISQDRTDPASAIHDEALEMMCRSVLVLSIAAARSMRGRGSGTIINVSVPRASSPWEAIPRLDHG